jgi:hypothetical protein
MSRSKKDIVDAAVREYDDAHRDEINAGIKTALGILNGTDVAACLEEGCRSSRSSRAGVVGPGHWFRCRSTRSLIPSSPAPYCCQKSETPGGAECVVLSDRVWFKVRTPDHRAAATELRPGEVPNWTPPSRGLVDPAVNLSCRKTRPFMADSPHAASGVPNCSA